MLQGKEWQAKAGAPADQIADLIAASGNTLPDDYLSFLRHSNGGEGELCVHPFWLVLDDADSVAKAMRDGTFAAFFPGLIVIGSNGAREAIAFDTRQGVVTGIVCFDMTNTDLAQSVQPLAGSFTELMVFRVASGA